LTDTGTPRARQAEETLCRLLDGLRGEVEDVAELLARERGATSADEDDVSQAWQIVIAAIRGPSHRRPW